MKDISITCTCVYNKEKKEIICYLDKESWKIVNDSGIRSVSIKEKSD